MVLFFCKKASCLKDKSKGEWPFIMKQIIDRYIQLLDGIKPEEWKELRDVIDNKMKLSNKNLE